MRSKSPELMEKIQDAVNSFFFREHKMPSVQEVADMAGIAKSSAHRYLVEMDRRHILTYRAGEILTKKIDSLSFSVNNTPVVGAVTCGLPVTEEEWVEEYIPLPTAIFGDDDMFIVRAKGDSMSGVGIKSGDLVVARRQQSAHIGDIVVALVDHQDSTLKRLMYDNKQGCQYLHPENPDYEDMYFDQIEIQGVMVNVIKCGPF